MHRTRLIFYPAAAVLIFLAILATGGAVNFFKNDFEQRWEELSKDVNKLNEYTTKHPNVELRQTDVEGKDLQSVVFNGATFENVKWENVDGSKAILTKVVFKKCKFIKRSGSNLDN